MAIAAALRAAARLLPPPVVRALKRYIAPRRDAAIISALAPLNATVQWEEPACAICGSTNQAVHHMKNGFRIVACRQDGLLFVSPRPTDVSRYYDYRYYTGGMPGVYQSYERHAGEMQNEWADRLRTLGTHLGDRRRLLDVGAATGDFLLLARECGWDAAGIELSEWAAEQARTKHGLEVTTGSLPHRAIAPASFDAITMWDCIEHVANPRAVLEAVRVALRPHGLLALSTGAVPHRDPEATSGWYYPPWHLFYFSRESMSEMLTQSGFDVLDYSSKDAGSPYELMTVLARPHKGRID